MTLPVKIRPRGKALRYAAWGVTALLATVAFGIAVPYLLLLAGDLRRSDWAQFSNEGQAYGGIAAVIGMIAIVGVIASLILQSREAAASRMQSERASHENLVLKSLDDPDLLECWNSIHSDPRYRKQHQYTNLIVSYWQCMLDIGGITEPQLRAETAHLFSTVPGRRYWAVAGPGRKSLAQSATYRRFARIMEDEYQGAIASRPVATERPEEVVGGPRVAASLVSGAIVGVLCGTVLSGAITAAVRHGRMPHSPCHARATPEDD